MRNKVEVFSINKSSQIILYGAASSGLLFFQQLTGEGYDIAAFIDKRANEISEFCGKRVFAFNQLDSLLNEFPDSIVIISIKNVFEHSKIAALLTDKGFTRIVFRPYSVLNGSDEESLNILNNAYTAIENQEYDSLLDLPYTHGAFDYDFKDYAIIKEHNSNITALVPVELIFSYDIDNAWGRLPMIAFYPHIYFFNTLQGKENNIQAYLDFCVSSAKRQGDIKTTDKWKKNVINNRVQSFEQMNLSLDIDPDFFNRNAPNARWNEKGNYFNLTSGKHRTTFLISCGRKFIALSISKSDYKKWVNCSKFNEIIDLKNIQNSELPFFISLPKLFKYPYHGESVIRRFFVRILSDIAEKSIDIAGVPYFQDKSVCCVGEFSDYFGFYLDKAGFEKCAIENIEYNEKYTFNIISDDYNKGWEKIKGDKYYITRNSIKDKEHHHKLIDSGFYKENKLYLYHIG